MASSTELKEGSVAKRKLCSIYLLTYMTAYLVDNHPRQFTTQTNHNRIRFCPHQEHHRTPQHEAITAIGSAFVSFFLSLVNEQFRVNLGSHPTLNLFHFLNPTQLSKGLLSHSNFPLKSG